ncbi:MAG: AbrB/MazE/SpoVT family DNA-binding domain-containing protein [Acidobacteria bacterium]|nr:AbrB/MazE/SpoVT family DNA-binding domain-containing protein [Acidobacteriota bacterium]
MKAQIIQIGNSQGIRIPKVLLEETGLSGEVELESTDDGGILIKNIRRPRGTWEAAFKALNELDDDIANADVPAADFDKKDWKW